jgi:hypothetical protein
MFRVRRALQRWALSGLMQVELVGDLGCDELMVGRWTASAMASASRKSFFCPFE